MKRATAVSYAAVTVLNALMCWKGAAFPVDLKLTAHATIRDEPGVKAPSKPVELAAKYAVMDSGKSLANVGFEVTIDSEIPRGVGLGSSSAAATAAYRAVYMLLRGSEPSPEQAAKRAAQACLRAGVSVTGAFDDALASITPGYIVVTDNWDLRLEKKIPLPRNVKVKVWVPHGLERPANLHERLREQYHAALKAYELLLDEQVWEAMTLNGFLVAAALGYPLKPILEELRRGALAAAVTGNGPAYAAVGEGAGYTIRVVVASR